MVESKKIKDCEMRFRINKEEKKQLEQKAKSFGFLTTSDYIRFVCLNTTEVSASND